MSGMICHVGAEPHLYDPEMGWPTGAVTDIRWKGSAETRSLLLGLHLSSRYHQSRCDKQLLSTNEEWWSNSAQQGAHKPGFKHNMLSYITAALPRVHTCLCWMCPREETVWRSGRGGRGRHPCASRMSRLRICARVGWQRLMILCTRKRGDAWSFWLGADWNLHTCDWREGGV